MSLANLTKLAKPDSGGPLRSRRHGCCPKSRRFQSQFQSFFFLNSLKKQKNKSQIVFECGCVNFSNEEWVIVSENSRRKKGPRSPTHLKHSVKRLSHFSCFSKISRNEQRKCKTKHYSSQLFLGFCLRVSFQYQIKFIILWNFNDWMIIKIFKVRNLILKKSYNINC